MSQADFPPRTGRPNLGWFRLALICLAVGIVWIEVLPYLASRPRMRTHLRWLDEQGIDPAAMYYTELEAMDAILDRIER